MTHLDHAVLLVLLAERSGITKAMMYEVWSGQRSSVVECGDFFMCMRYT